MTNEFYVISQLTILIPIIIGIYFKSKLNESTRLLLYYLVIGALVEVISQIARDIFFSNNLIYNPYIWVQFLCVILSYKKEISFQVKNWLSIILFIGLILMVFDFVLITGPLDFNAISLASSSLVLIVIILIYLLNLLIQLGTVRFQMVPFFWISIGLLLYFASNILIYLGYNHLPKLDMKVLWPITWGTAIIKNILIAIGFYLCYKQLNQPPSTSFGQR